MDIGVPAQTLVILGVVGLVVTRGVDFLRTAFDKHDSVPKAYWLLAAWVIGIGVAWAVSTYHPLTAMLHLPDQGTFGIVLTGLGFGSVAGFWHEALSALSARSGVAATPKGLVATKSPQKHNRRAED